MEHLLELKVRAHDLPFPEHPDAMDKTPSCKWNLGQR